MNFLRFWYRTTMWLYLFSVFIVVLDPAPAYIYMYVVNTIPIIYMAEKYRKLGVCVDECRYILESTAKYTKIFIVATTITLIMR